MTTYRPIGTLLIAAGSLLAAVGLARADGEARQSYDSGGDRGYDTRRADDRDGRSAPSAQRDWYERGAMQSRGQWNGGWRGGRDDNARFGFNVNQGWSPYYYYYYGPNVYAYQGYQPPYPAYGYSYPAYGPSYPAYGYGYSGQPGYGSSYSGYGYGYPAYAPPAWPQAQDQGSNAPPPFRGKCLQAYNQGYHDGYAAGSGGSPGYYNYRR
jgi:hypothetical protein